MSKNARADSGVVVVYDGSMGVGVDFDVLFVVVFEDAADAEPATNTASVTPNENVTSVAATATALRREPIFLTTHHRGRSPVAPGSRSLPGAGRAGLRSHSVPRAQPGPRSSAAGRRRAWAGRRCRRSEAPLRR